MDLGSRILSLLPVICFSMWLSSCRIEGLDNSDVLCLKRLKESVQDPFKYLNSSWNFDNTSAAAGYICKFTGVECWHPDENRVMNLELSDMGLKGPFPRAIKNCSSMIGLDLSSNNFDGSIPTDISHLIPYATTVDLSSNSFSGEIPASFKNCTYLNSLKLDHNRLSGQIPAEFSLLGRLTQFSVANNLLSGPVPSFGQNTTVNYDNNPGLCGGVHNLPKCIINKNSNTKIIVASAVAGETIAAIGVAIGMLLYLRKSSVKKKEEDPEGNKWAKSLKKGSKGIKVIMFKKTISKMRLSDLMKATNNFSKRNIIGSGRTGITYKAMVEDNTLLLVKRLQGSISQHPVKEVMSELASLGRIKHRNLVPLLGFCLAKKERLLVYSYMPNGTLHEHLHSPDGLNQALEWSLRLKIGIGAARGLAWLHHNCNPRIIHRNISSKCILLDAEFEPRISHFGIRRLMNPIDTHLRTSVKGELRDLGYVAPEYLRTVVATPQGDVYGFGVVLLELVTGEKPTQVPESSASSFNGNLVNWIADLSSNLELHDAMDESLIGKGVDDEVLQVLKVARSCVSRVPKERPTMFEVYQHLKAIGDRYHLSADDDIIVPTDNGNSDCLAELVVAQEVTEQCS